MASSLARKMIESLGGAEDLPTRVKALKYFTFDGKKFREVGEEEEIPDDRPFYEEGKTYSVKKNPLRKYILMYDEWGTSPLYDPKDIFKMIEEGYVHPFKKRSKAPAKS